MRHGAVCRLESRGGGAEAKCGELRGRWKFERLRTASVVGRVRVCAPEAAPETSEKIFLDISRPAKIGYTSQEFGGKEWSSAALSGGHAFQVGMMREGLARA